MCQVKRIIVATTALCLSTSHAGSVHNGFHCITHPKVNPPLVAIAANVWANVTEIYYPDGSIVKGSGNSWIEFGSNNATFNFVEIGRDNSSIYLRDDGRGVNLQLNLQAEKIFYSDDNGNSYSLYDVTGIKASGSDQDQGQIGQAASVSVVEYSCTKAFRLFLNLSKQVMTCG